MKSVRTKIVGLVVASLMLALGIYSTLLYINLQQIVVANQEEHLSNLAVAACKDMALWLDGRKREMSAVSDSISLAGDKRSSIKTLLKIHARNNPEYEMVFYSDTKGNAFTSSDFMANIQNRAYFQKALDTGRAVVSDPVVSHQSKRPIVAIVSPVKKGGLVAGVVGCTIPLDYLSQLISHIRPFHTGYAFVVQGDGTTIIHPDKELALKYNVLKDPQIGPSLKNVVGKMINQKTGVAIYVHDNIEKYIIFAPVPGTDWSLAINTPVDEVLEQLAPMNRLIIGTPVFVVILASALIGFLLIILIVRPITTLRNMMSLVEKGDLDARVEHVSRDEIGQLADSFNRMVETIKFGRKKLEQSEDKYRSLFENAVEGIFQTSPEGRFVSANPALAKMFGYSSPQDFMEQITDIGKQHYVNQEDRQRYRNILERDGVVKGFETKLVNKQGNHVWASISATLVRDNEGRVIYYEGTVEDITGRKELEQQLHNMSLTDELTGLYNRRGFITLSEQQLKMTTRTEKDMLLFFVDLDKMKHINDTFGHKEGDKALVDVAAVLKEVFRGSDIIGRMGGDEFAILAIDTHDETGKILLDRLRKTLDSLNRTGGRNYLLSLSVGIANYDHEKPCSLDELIILADSSMYEEKRNKQH